MYFEATIILPNQLFHENELLKAERPIFLVEDARYFTDFTFHKHKLMFHRASMRWYYDHLKQKNYNVHYIEFNKSHDLFKILKQNSIHEVHYYDPVDFVIEKRFKKEAEANTLILSVYETPLFLTSQEWLNSYYADEKKEFFMASFYKDQRKKLHILMTPNGSPVGGKWSYDTENRNKLAATIKIPSLTRIHNKNYVIEAGDYIENHFKNNPGCIDNFWFETTHEDAKKWFKNFLEKRFSNFGIYQDAIIEDQAVLFHSVISPYLNTGLLTPDCVIQTALLYAEKHSLKLNTVEGFVRQIIGWREFMRALYVFDSKKEQTTNFWNHTRKIPKSFWQGTVGIDPLDCAINKVISNSYVHHIERLMILGNFMLLCEFDPQEVYSWFMELFIDAYDWVMVPNIYGMSQYADGGLMATKPYISSSAYILKMSNFKKGPWCEIWDALYWNFIYNHKKYFASLGRLAVMSYHIDKMPAAKLKKHLTCAQEFLNSLQ